jgi:paraquat-inducible protein A
VTALKAANLVLLALFPVAWFAPLLRAGLLPFFRLDEISVISGLAVLWRRTRRSPCWWRSSRSWRRWRRGCARRRAVRRAARLLHGVHLLGRLAMADIFLIALYIVAAKGVGVGRVETAWGLWLFTFCVLGSLVVAHLTERALKRPAAPA